MRRRGADRSAARCYDTLADDVRAASPARSRSCHRSTSTTSAAPSCSTRSRRCPSTTPPAASARSSTATRPAIIERSGADELVELGLGHGLEDARAAVRDGRARAASSATCRSTWTSRWSRRRRPSWSRPTPGCACTAWSATSAATSARSPTATAGCSPSSAARSATSTPTSGPRSWPRCAT